MISFLFLHPAAAVIQCVILFFPFFPSTNVRPRSVSTCSLLIIIAAAVSPLHLFAFGDQGDGGINKSFSLECGRAGGDMDRSVQSVGKHRGQKGVAGFVTEARSVVADGVKGWLNRMYVWSVEG